MKQGPTDLVDIVDLVWGVINPMLALYILQMCSTLNPIHPQFKPISAQAHLLIRHGEDGSREALVEAVLRGQGRAEELRHFLAPEKKNGEITSGKLTQLWKIAIYS